MTSRLRTGQIYRIYLRFLWYAFLFTLAAIVVGFVGTIVVGAIVGEEVSHLGEIFATTAAIGLYVAMALGYSTIYQATVKLGVWRCVVEYARHRQPRRRSIACPPPASRVLRSARASPMP